MAVYRDFEVDIPKNRVTIEKQKGGKLTLIKNIIESPFNKAKGYPEPSLLGKEKPEWQKEITEKKRRER